MSYFVTCSRCGKRTVMPDRQIVDSPAVLRRMDAAVQRIKRSHPIPVTMCRCPRGVNNRLLVVPR